jgi:hypothetical protein
MTRWLGVLAAFTLAALSVAAPVPKSLRSKAPNVAGTMWVSDETAVDLGVLEYTFHEGGKLTWKRTDGDQVWTAGTWKQEGDHLYWEVNERYVDYNTDFNGGRFEGGAVNKNNLKWKITLTPKEK